MNKFFKEYSRLYYGENGVFSVYVWEQGDSIENGFSSAILVKNVIQNSRGINKGEWDSINIVNVKFLKEMEKDVERIKATYKLNSTVIFKISVGQGEISGNVTRQTDESHYMKSFLDNEIHLEKIGRLVENMENNLRIQIEEIYFKKTSEIVNKLKINTSGGINKNIPVSSNNLAELFNKR